MSEPDDPRWLNDVSGELRREVPVRAAWRARLLDDVARLPRPSADDELDDPMESGSSAFHASTRRRLTVTPLRGLAAALLFAALGAGTTYLALSSGARSSPDAIAKSGNATGLRGASGVSPDSNRELVRFQLSAPNASRVMLVGSFNEWNPVATPLVRDPSSGTWTVSVRLPPGRHVYAFVVDGDVTADPTAPRAADNDFGSANSVVLVSGRSS